MIDFAIAVVVLVALLLLLQAVPIPEAYKRILTIVLGAIITIYLLLCLAAVVGTGSVPRLFR